MQGDPGDLPQTFVIKLPAQDDTVRDRVTIGYRSECTFYSTVVDRVRVPTPRCFYCQISEDALESRPPAGRSGTCGAGRSDRGLR